MNDFYKKNEGKELQFEKAYDVVIPCNKRHLHILKLTMEGINKLSDVNKIYILTNKNNIKKKIKLSKNAIAVDEDTIIPSMTLNKFHICRCKHRFS